MAYYHEIITEKSWQILQELKRNHKFILIGGWAVFLYTKNLKSKDIDIICGFEELDHFKEDHELIKNDRLKKYEIHQDGIDIDIYVPFFSNLGAPVEEISSYVTQREGFTILSIEALVITKLRAWLDRGHSLKGEKDKIDIIGMLKVGINYKKFKELLRVFGLKDYTKVLQQILNITKEAPQLELNAHQYARLKKRIIDQLQD